MANLNNGNEPDGRDKGPPAVTLSYETATKVNFASAQNDVAIIKRIAIDNPTPEPLTDVRITLRSAPPIIREKVWTVDRIASGSEFVLRDLSTPLDIERLAGLDEAEIGELELRVEAHGLPTVVEKCRVDLLARDEWGGLGDMAQILAASVSPNAPAVARVVKDAARLLEAAGHDGSMNGYQSGDPRRAYLLAASIWSAVTGLALTYAEPPASFESEGQKIRSPDRITQEGLATCLDLSLFLAAAFEAAGLHPVVLFAHGHALVGVWICKKDFGHVTEPDIVAVRKAVQAHEFFPIETTLLTKRPSIGFDHAVDEGRRRLTEDRDPEFVMAVDIARSRAARIRPLASHRSLDPSETATADEVAPAALPPLPDFGLLADELSDETAETPRDRIARWQRKLLDLSLRNRLLNYRDSKQTLPLRCPSVGALEDALAAGKSFRGLSLKEDDPLGNRTPSPEERQRIEEDVVLAAFERSQLAVPLTGGEMNRRFLTLYRRARSDMQEGGTNTLFLATGFLRWRKSEGDTRTYRAPLVPIPVKLERRSAQSPFRISHHEDDVRINSTLLEFLNRDFDLRIPEFEGDLPRDDSGIDLPRIFDILRRKVRDVAGFEVVEELALSTFSFAKYLMWKDLVDRTDKLRTNRLVSHLIDGATETYAGPGSGAPLEPRELDRRLAPRDLLLPLPADSSQLAAVLAASQGQDFVLIGPPGTGKSQTIANMIAQCLGTGRTVLFVAEKAAALDVVHRRLAAGGLADAVLELHSNKTDRKSVIAQLGRGWHRAYRPTGQKWIEVTEGLRLSRDRLNAYVEAPHAKGSQGFSVFDAVGRAASGKAPFELAYDTKDAHDEKSYKRLVALAADLGRTHAAAGDGTPLSLIRGEKWSFHWEAELLEAARDVREALGELGRSEKVLARELGFRPDPNLEAARRERLKSLAPRAERSALDLSSVPDMPGKSLKDKTLAFTKDMRELAAAVADFAAGLVTVEEERARLPDWVRWVEKSTAALKCGLGPLVRALEGGLVEGDPAGAFEIAYATWWLPLAMDAREELRGFTRSEHESVIAKFRELDEGAAGLAPVEIRRRIDHGLPTRNRVPKKSELGTLRHQLDLKRPSMPIRALLASLPETLGKLTPCVLMSPLSVAQYLPAEQAAFDVVIFDEASQITTWDAIGAIARARQTIIVGDPKQLPPTNFFGRADDGDEDLPEIERDMPSILEEVSASGVPHHLLDWHYRSRDEALIAFSNHFYYDSRLVTFPAPAVGSGALRFHKVNGTYARGRGRVNDEEARAISEMVERRLTTWVAEPESERHTLGVITFNAEQQTRILDRLDEIRRRDPRLEWFFADERDEPVIVKNLENIQGDERDVMLFSVTFGPDLAGKLTMNFGAINGTGGEKRLNVAITRARRELHVFSSIRAEQIDRERTRAVGVHHLKAFLDYAERGAIALPSRDEGSLGPAESPFEEAVAAALGGKGWEVRTQIGVSGFRVDLGVVHPDFAGSYLAGVECDGARYHSSATARDRDKLRQEVLEELGWNVLRVWSTDWFRNPLIATKKLDAKLREDLQKDRDGRAAANPEPEAEVRNDGAGREPFRSADAPEPASLDIETDAIHYAAKKGAESEESGPTRPLEDFETVNHLPGTTDQEADNDGGASLGADESARQTGIDADRQPPTPRSEAGPALGGIAADPARFFDYVYTLPLRRMILSIVENEGPITLHRLTQRVAQEHGWQRAGRRIQERVRKNLGRVERHPEFESTFVWAPGSHAARVPFRGLNGRPVREVSRAEIASVLDAHSHQLESAEDPIFALSRLLGISRLSKDARAYLSDCTHWWEQD